LLFCEEADRRSNFFVFFEERQAKKEEKGRKGREKAQKNLMKNDRTNSSHGDIFTIVVVVVRGGRCVVYY
jgi:hypothetical protein